MVVVGGEGHQRRPAHQRRRGTATAAKARGSKSPIALQWLRKPRSPARGSGAVQRARIIVPVTRATILLIEVGSCARTLWTRPKPTTSVTQESASITTLRCVRRLSASSEELFMLPPNTSLSLVGASRQKVQVAALYI